MSPKVIRSSPIGEDVVAYAAKAVEPLGTIGFPVRDHLSAPTVISLITTSFSRGGHPVDVCIVQGNVLTTQRNELIRRMRGDWLLFIDDDMVWQPEQVQALINVREEHDLDMVGGLCFRRSEPHQPTLYMRETPTTGAYNFLESWDADVVEVDATGMAFMLIHKRVFEGMVRFYEDKPGWTMPSAEARLDENPPNFFRWEGQLGEDLRFCQEARRAGFRIWVDTRIEIKHIGEIAIGHEHFLRQLAMRPDDVIATRREVNDAMGLPTVSREKARELLGW